jgi:hypothetical protein
MNTLIILSILLFIYLFCGWIVGAALFIKKKNSRGFRIPVFILLGPGCWIFGIASLFAMTIEKYGPPILKHIHGTEDRRNSASNQ